MDRLETLVRDVLAEHADDAPPPDGLLEAVEHRPRRLLAALTAAAVVIAVAVGIVTFRPNSHSATTPAAPQIPPSYHRIAYRGITIAVPRRLPVTTDSCGPNLANYVLASDGQIHGCPAFLTTPPRPRFTVDLEPFTKISHYVPTHPATMNGLTVRLGYGHIPDREGHAGVLIVPRMSIRVTVVAPSARAVRLIIGSVRMATDPHGCMERLGSNYLAANRPATELVPGHPVSAARCVYAPGVTNHALADNYVIASYAIDADKLTEIVAALRRLPLAPNDHRGSRTPEPQELFLFRYRNGAVRDIALETGRTGALILTDGQLRSARGGERVFAQLVAAAR